MYFLGQPGQDIQDWTIGSGQPRLEQGQDSLDWTARTGQSEQLIPPASHN